MPIKPLYSCSELGPHPPSHTEHLLPMTLQEHLPYYCKMLVVQHTHEFILLIYISISFMAMEIFVLCLTSSKRFWFSFPYFMYYHYGSVTENITLKHKLYTISSLEVITRTTAYGYIFLSTNLSMDI